jgi:hypothetical protein
MMQQSQALASMKNLPIHSILKSLCPLEDNTEAEENGTHELQLYDAHFIYFLDID